MTLHHASLETRPADVDAAVAFWDVLGFARIDPPKALVGRAVWLDRAGTQIHLLLTDSPVVAPQGHVAVVAEELAAALDRLRGLGHEPEERERHWGAARVYVTAPGGHRVEIMAAPP